MKMTLIAAFLIAFAIVAPAAEAHIGTSGGCSWYDIDVDPSHWHVCAGTLELEAAMIVVDGGIGILA